MFFSNLKNKIYLFFKTFFLKKDVYLWLGIFFLTAIVLLFNWGKMQLGDYSTELANGLMIKSGLIPYQDFYIHTMPLISYLSAFFEIFNFPIHLVNLVGVFNFFITLVIILYLSNLLNLDYKNKILGIVAFLAIYSNSITSLTHHSLDVVLFGMVTVGVVALIKKDYSVKYFWQAIVVVSLCSVADFFITQHIGLAAMVLGPLVLIVDYWWNKNRDSLMLFKKLFISELIFLMLALFLFGFVGRVSLSSMFESTFVKGAGQYSQTYGYGKIWKTSLMNLESAYYKYLVHKPVDFSNVSPDLKTAPILDVSSKPLPSKNFFTKIFLYKSALLYSIFNLAVSLFVVIMTLWCLIIVVKNLLLKQYIDPIFLIWGASLGVFLLSSIMVFQINFSAFYCLLLFWLYSLHYIRNSYIKTFFNIVKYTFLIFAFFIALSNFTVLGFEYYTRQYYVSRVGNERVWTSPFYYHDFVDQFNEILPIVDKEFLAQIATYPRASEINYLLNLHPKAGSTFVAFYRPGGEVSDSVKTILNSDLAIIFEPRYFGLGEEHNYAMDIVKPALNQNFIILFSNKYFKIYKRR